MKIHLPYGLGLIGSHLRQYLGTAGNHFFYFLFVQTLLIDYLFEDVDIVF